MLKRVAHFLILLGIALSLCGSNYALSLSPYPVESAAASGVIIIKPDETPKTKSLKFDEDGTVLLKINQQNGFSYRMNNQEIRFHSPLRWQILAVRSGDILSFTSESEGEWLQYFYNSFGAWYLMLFCTVASFLSIFINSVQVLTQRRHDQGEAYIRITIDFLISVSIVLLNTVGLLYGPMQVVTFFVSSTFMHAMLLPNSLKAKIRIFKIIGTIGLCYVILSFAFNSPASMKELLILWNKFIGFLGMGGILIYLILFLLIKLRVMGPKEIDFPYVFLMAFTNVLTMYYYFFKQELMLLTGAPYSFYFAYKSIVSLVNSEKNKVRAEQMAQEVEVKNKILETKNSEVIDLNLNLEQKVLAKTRDIQALLDQLPQGVLSIGSDLRIRKEYSKVLPSILGQDKIAGEDFKAMFIDHSQNLSLDERDQFYQAIYSMVGEAYINFELNGELLPSLIKYNDKWLRCTYSADARDMGSVDKITVTLLDISKEIENEESAKVQKERMAVVAELVNLSPEKASEFFESSINLLAKVEEWLGASVTVKECQNILVALHTVKGAARTYYFKSLTEEIHRAEQLFSDVVKGVCEFSSAKAASDFQSVMECFEMYRDINTNLLGRKSIVGKILVDRSFLSRAYQVVTHVAHATDEKSSLYKELIEHKAAILNLALYKAETVMGEALSGVPSLARQLHKESPRIVTHCEEVFLDSDQRRVILLSFLHLVRNSLDHGIESAEERLRSNKPAQGQMNVQLRKLGRNHFEISLRDDGRGLALAAIRAKGLEKKIVLEGASKEEVAHLIFKSGFSTAAGLTDISGRGVGMDAVRKLFEEIGGTVSIRLGAPKDSAGHFYDFEIVIELPISENI